MPSLALQTFRDVLTVHGADFVFVRGAAQTPVRGAPGVREYNVTDGDGLRTTWSSHDIVVAAEDLVIAGVAVLPRRGDVFQRTVGATVHSFEVQFPDPHKPPYRWSDDAGLVLMIHTVLANSAPA